MIRDVPSPIDFTRPEDAAEWEASAMVKRPWRTDVFARFATELRDARRVLELGSGPGFLADHLLGALPAIAYVALDFSAPMHALAAQRLGSRATRVRFEQRNFLDAAWTDGLGLFCGVVTLQAVHELRHKLRAATLHAQVRTVLAPGGAYLVCDHALDQGGPQNDDLYMTTEEQAEALRAAGFARVECVLALHGLVLHRAIA